MKKILIILVLALTGAAFPVTVPGNGQRFAVSGCCKERKSYKHPWVRNGMNFKQCQEYNQDQDGKEDDVLDKSGYVWWDVNC